MGYRDGLKSRGDKIGMPCTHTTVILDTCNSQPKRINDTSPILSQRHTAEAVVYMQLKYMCLVCGGELNRSNH